MRKANTEIREAMREKHVPAWAIGEALGVHENTVLRHLRTELNSTERERIVSVIDRIAEENAEKAVDANV